MKFSLRKHVVGNVETRVLPDIWLVKVKSVQYPVVKLSSDFKLQRTQRMGDSFKTVAKWVSVVVQGVNAPFVSDVGMGSESDSVNDRVSQGGVGMLVVDFSSQ